jgi:hypothetical protein
MATSLRPSPIALVAQDEEDPDLVEIEVEIANDENDDDDDLCDTGCGDPDEPDEHPNLPDDDFAHNLAEDMDPSQLSTIASDLHREFEEDINSRKEWVTTYVDGLELLGTNIEDRTEPWPGACGVYHPLMAEALVRFQADTMMETFPAQGPIKTKIIGRETPEKRDAAARVKEDMNYQLTERMVEYRPEHERMLWGLGLSGNAFKKVYFDPGLDRQTSMYVPAEDLVVPYGASSIESAERVAHVMRKTPNEIKKLQAAGFYIDTDLGEPTDTFDEIEKKIAEKLGFRADIDDRHKLLEMHVALIIPDDQYRSPEEDELDIALPYVVTFDKQTLNVLAIRRNWNQDDPLKAKRQHFVHYSYVPGFGFYALGMIHLLGAFAKSGTSIIRQLVDAGTLSNLPGGFKTKGLRIKGDDVPITPGEWRDVDIGSGTLQDNLRPLPYKEPSVVLFQLLQFIVEAGQRFAAAADLKISDMSAQAPVGTTLAILERMLKIMSAVQARVHFSMKQELKLLKAIIRDNTPNDYTYEPDGADKTVKQDDYDCVDVIPISDPNAATMAQKIVQYQAVLQLASGAPQLYNLPLLHRQMLEVLGIQNASKLVPMPDDDDRVPQDPVSENMNVLMGKPVLAFIYQDHDSHIVVHMGAMQDPQMQQMLQGAPNTQAIMGAMQAHIQQHMAYSYRKQIEDEAGVPLPPMNAQLEPEVEIAISRLAAQATQQLTGKKQAMQQAQQNAAASQDPIVQLQQAELQIKGREVTIKEKKLDIDAAAKADDIRLREEKIISDRQIAGVAAGAKIASSKAQIQSDQQLKGVELGMQVGEKAIGPFINPPPPPAPIPQNPIPQPPQQAAPPQPQPPMPPPDGGGGGPDMGG